MEVGVLAVLEETVAGRTQENYCSFDDVLFVDNFEKIYQAVHF
jgi:hypothetical protein